MCCGIITFGYFVGIDQEGVSGKLLNLNDLFRLTSSFLSAFILSLGIISWKGVFYGILSSCCVSLNSIYRKKVLPAVEHSVLALNLYNNLIAAALFVPIMFAVGELPNQIFVGQMLEFHFWFLMVVGGFCGVAIGFATALQIQVF